MSNFSQIVQMLHESGVPLYVPPPMADGYSEYGRNLLSHYRYGQTVFPTYDPESGNPTSGCVVAIDVGPDTKYVFGFDVSDPVDTVRERFINKAKELGVMR